MALTVKPLEKVRKTVPVREVANPSKDELVRVNIAWNIFKRVD